VTTEVLPDEGKSEERGLIPFFPNYILDEVIAWYVALGLLIVLASLLPTGLEEQADPLSTPAHVKPEWYFLSLYQALKFVPRFVGVVAPAIGVVLLLFVPFIDRGKGRSLRSRWAAVAVGAVVIVVIVALTLWGWLS
jgi:cytochrome b6-f complex subunit 4